MTKDVNGAEITVTQILNTTPAPKTDMELLREDVAAIKAKLGIP